MRLSPIVDQLKAAGCARVYGALELAGLDKQPAQLPAYFVVPEGERADPNRTDGGAHQQIFLFRFAIVVLLPSAGLNERRVSDEADEHATKVKAAIAGWTHPDAASACNYAGGSFLAIRPGVAAWSLSFTAKGLFRRVPA